MIVDVLRLEAMLFSDLRAASGEIDAVTRLEGALSDAAGNYDIGTSSALDSLRDYIARVRLPATTVLRDYLSTFASDIQADQARLIAKVSPLGALVDTNIVQRLIDGYYHAATQLEGLSDYVGLIPSVSRDLRAQALNLRELARRTQGYLDQVIDYLNGADTYSATKAAGEKLLASQKALESVRASSIGGVARFDLSRADLSWVPVQDDDYWRRRNSQTLQRYFVFSAEEAVAGIAGIQPGEESRVRELAELAWRCLLGRDAGTGMPTEIDNLTSDEKYVVLWLLSKWGEPVLSSGTETVIQANSAFYALFGISAADAGIDGIHVLETSRVSGIVDDHFTGNLSFKSDGDILYSVDRKGSIQQRNGFSDVTELGGPLLGMDLDTAVVVFEYEGYEYRLQVWDGSYGFGMAFGGEVGLYRRKVVPGATCPYSHMSAEYIRENVDTLTSDQVRSAYATYETVPDEDQPKIKVSVNGGQSNSVYIDQAIDNTYWLFAARDTPLDNWGRPQAGFMKDSLQVGCTLDFGGDIGLMEATEAALLEELGGSVEKVKRGTDGESLQIVWSR